jgi:hypothetical protein
VADTTRLATVFDEPKGNNFSGAVVAAVPAPTPLATGVEPWPGVVIGDGEPVGVGEF